MYPVVLLALLSTMSTTSGFLLDDCEAPPGCSCYLSIIRCDGKMFPRIPVFNIRRPYGLLYLHLQHNNIIVVPERSFVGINATQLYIDVSSNRIYDMHPQAFEDVEDKVTILKLGNNNMKTIPTAITNLTSLVYLDIHDNPIKTFDPLVLQTIGSHLEVFYVGSSAMTSWPSDFRMLTHLNGLHVFNVPMTRLPDDAFDGFAGTLINFEVDGSNFESIPGAICSLQKVVNVHFSQNHNMSGDSIVPNCTAPVISVTTVNIDDNSLTTFPDIFDLFPNMLSLSVTYNPDLVSMGTVQIPNDTLLTGMFLKGNNFQRIPLEIEELTSLHSLDISSNNITTIHDGEMDHLSHLTRLFIDDNPIKIIDNHALRNLTSLLQLGLANLALGNIPRAVLDLEKVHTIDMGAAHIECSCRNLGWMRNWTLADSVLVQGYCAAPRYGEQIEQFLQLDFQNC